MPRPDGQRMHKVAAHSRIYSSEQQTPFSNFPRCLIRLDYNNVFRIPITMRVPHKSWLNVRASGVLAHISSLPGDQGIGNLGAGARAFVDFLADAGFHYWQICPSGPTGYGDSPYQSFSSFAGNPYFIDLGELVAEGLLTESEVAPLRDLPEDSVDYGWLYNLSGPVLARAHARFMAMGAKAPWGGRCPRCIRTGGGGVARLVCRLHGPEDPFRRSTVEHMALRMAWVARRARP